MPFQLPAHPIPDGPPPAAPERQHCGTCRFALRPRWADPGKPFLLPDGITTGVSCTIHERTMPRLLQACAQHEVRPIWRVRG